ncbi:MAG: GNAT family N-acetyltransferase [Anaerovibrio sp.]|uniref:GNAT family N-acetyltransferase n=1 Tax=Anaerovibrio sp. TaxID=1872532 RepID=UPI0025C2AAA3|nr:GNAT family N-acetyltransferase [Anaerovibrio sp.]MBE6100424.1 GNAT family N-acetyltransferase [Anaerovibrio sp.]
MKIVNGKDFILQVKNLIIEYTERLGRDLTFQHIDEELQNPATKYTAPEGEILVALEGKEVLGMVAYHKHDKLRCEMKRLYVKPKARGLHLGETLVQEIISHAQRAGFKEMVLDTITPLKSAIHLYEKYGFVQCEPYYNNPMDDVIYMRKEL